MSLSVEEWDRASKKNSTVREKVVKIIGFDPTVVNHYGMIYLYNEELYEDTTEEEISEIREKYLDWKQKIIGILAENNIFLDNEKFSELFSVDFMFGSLTFLGINVNIYEDVEIYRKVIKCLLDGERIDKVVLEHRVAHKMLPIISGNDVVYTCEEFYRKTLKGGLKNE